jgi:hypothetical protein
MKNHGHPWSVSTWPNPARFVGWFFQVPGAALLTLTMVIGAARLVGKL